MHEYGRGAAMRRTSILLDDALLTEARAVAARQRTTFTGLVREALAAYIATQERPRPLSIVGIGRSEEGDLSTRDEEILAAEIGRDGWSPERRPQGGSGRHAAGAS